MRYSTLSSVRALWLMMGILFFVARPPAAAEDKLIVVATLFPQYDFARTIAGQYADVSFLLPPGTETHSYEPTPSAMKKIAAADIFIYTGEHMEPWAKRLADAVAPGGARIVDASQGIELMKSDDIDEDEDDHDHDSDLDHDHHHHLGDEAHFHEYDPHIWLDPVRAAQMVDVIAVAFVDADPAHTVEYLANAAKLRDDILALHREFEKTVAAAPRHELVFGERFAFGYFFHRYGLEEIGAYKSCAPGAEPGLKAVIEVVDHVKEDGIKYIYLDAMSTSRISGVIQQETGAEILLVDSLHNPSAEAREAGATYVGIMKENMDAFARGLE